MLLFLLGCGHAKDENEEGGGAAGNNWGHGAVGGAIAKGVRIPYYIGQYCVCALSRRAHRAYLIRAIEARAYLLKSNK